MRPNINYNLINQGTSEATDHRDYNEVSTGQAVNTVKPPVKKLTNLKINQEVFKKSVEFFKRIRESTHLSSLTQVAQSCPEFQTHLEALNQIEKNLKEYKYAATHQMQQDFLKMMRELVKAAHSDVSFHGKVLEFHIYAESLV